MPDPETASTGCDPPREARRGTRRDALGQLARFGCVGAFTVVVDFTLYRLLHAAGLAISPSKATSFVVATVCAYLLNRVVTFRAQGGRQAVARFVALYAVALAVNVTINQLMLWLLADSWSFEVEAAFVAAQATSSTINFVGMRRLVFTDRACGGQPGGVAAVGPGAAFSSGAGPR